MKQTVRFISLVLLAGSFFWDAPAQETVPVVPDADGFVFLEFEDAGLPEGLELSGSQVALDASRRLRGIQSLRWEWQAGAELKFNLPVACDPSRNGWEDGFAHGRTFKFWIYSETALPGEQLRVVFGDSRGEPCSFPFNLDFTGWRTAWVMFDRDMEGAPDRDLTYIRLVAPSGAASGTFWIDDLAPALSQDIRHQTPDWQVPFVQREVYLDQGSLYTDRSIGPPAEIPPLTAEDQAGFDVIGQRLATRYPARSDSTAGLEQTFLNSYLIVKDADGKIRGPYLPHLGALAHLDGFPPRLYAEIEAGPNFDAFTGFMLKVAKNYIDRKGQPGAEAEAQRLKEIFLLMSEHLLDQGWQQGSSQGTLHHFGYASRSWAPAVFLMRAELEEAGLLAGMSDSMTWFFGLLKHYTPPTTALANMDYLNTIAFSELVTLSCMPDGAAKAHFLCTFADSLCTGLLLPSPGSQGGIKSDGSLFHHKMHYAGYGVPGLRGAVDVLEALDGTRYEFTVEAYELLKHAALRARLWGFPWSGFNACGRHPLVSAAQQIPDSVRRLATAVPGTDGIDGRLAAAYLKMAGGDSRALFGQAVGPENPQGAWTMNYHNGGIYKHGNSTVLFKAYSDGVRAQETYDDDNRYGRYQSHGTVMVFQNTREHPSGFLEPGWGWSQPPGATTLIVEPLEVLERSTSFYGARPPQKTPFGGAADLFNEFGLCAFRLDEDPASPDDESIQVRKSILAVDGKLISLGSGLSSAHTEFPLVTTLFQTALRSGNETVLAQGAAEPLQQPADLSWTAGDAGASWLIDPYGTGHYCAPGSALRLTIGQQISRHNKTRELTAGDFAKAWIDHGLRPGSAGYEYVSLLDADAAAMEQFSAQMASGSAFYTVLRRDSTTHALHVPEQQLWSLVSFEPLAGAVGPFRQVDSPSLVLLQQVSENRMRMSVTDPRVGLEATNMAPAVEIFLEIEGSYRPSGEAVGVQATSGDGTTKLTVRCADGKPTAFYLEKVEMESEVVGVVFEEDFAGETVSSLAADGWRFSGQPDLERVARTDASDLMGAGKEFLCVGGLASAQPFAEVAFGSVGRGRMTLRTFSSSSYSQSRIKLLDEAGRTLFAFLMPSPQASIVENTGAGFVANPMPNEATHNLLGSSGNSLSELLVDWDGNQIYWRLRNLDADSGAVVWDSGLIVDSFGVDASSPAQLRLDTGTYNHASRYFGVTDLRIVRSEETGYVDWRDGLFSSADLAAGLGGADVDADADGRSNYEEYLAGTDPVDAASAFRARAAAAGIEFATAAGRSYDVEYRTNLLSGGWVPLVNDFPGSGAAVLLDNPTAEDNCFYRVRARQP